MTTPPIVPEPIDPLTAHGDQTTRITVHIKRSELRMFLLLLPETINYLQIEFVE